MRYESLELESYRVLQTSPTSDLFPATSMLGFNGAVRVYFCSLGCYLDIKPLSYPIVGSVTHDLEE